jgi:hypothetical protein
MPATGISLPTLGVVMIKFYFLGLLLSVVVSTIQPHPVLAEENGAALLEKRCSGCHPSSTTTSRKKTPEQWHDTISRMKHRGARLTEEEMKILVDYLSETFQP